MASLAAQAMIDKGYFGFVWADQQLFARERCGGLADGVKLGDSICRSVPALYGLETQILSLSDPGSVPLEVPNVAMPDASGQVQRLNYVVMWEASSGRFLLTISRPIAIDELSVELQRETRRRVLAETELVEQAKAIEQANVALRRANEDLNAFTRIISHDLKAPMRAMRYFAEDLEAALKDPGGDDPHTHLDRLKAQSRRMSAMITGLLAYSRLDGDELSAHAVDSRRLVDEVVASLARPEEMSVNITGQWPHISNCPELFDLVLRNLIENAIKHHDRTAGCVALTAFADETGETLTVKICDDGPGIAQQYQQAVFMPFSKLIAQENLDGTGLGLTLVERAVDKAGATLVLHSQPDLRRGTTFVLNWPLKAVAA